MAVSKRRAAKRHPQGDSRSSNIAASGLSLAVEHEGLLKFYSRRDTAQETWRLTRENRPWKLARTKLPRECIATYSPCILLTPPQDCTDPSACTQVGHMFVADYRNVARTQTKYL